MFCASLMKRQINRERCYLTAIDETASFISQLISWDTHLLVGS